MSTADDLMTFFPGGVFLDKADTSELLMKIMNQGDSFFSGLSYLNNGGVVTHAIQRSDGSLNGDMTLTIKEAG
jgi:hypothetical protein